MKKTYNNQYYDHFSKQFSLTPPVFAKETNYLMRFFTQLPTYRFDNSNLTIVYFKEGSGVFFKNNKTLRIEGDKFIVVNPGEGWEYVNSKGDFIDVLSLVVAEGFKEQFDFFVHSSFEEILDNPCGRMTNGGYFIEQALSADNYRSGRRLKAFHELSNSLEYSHTSPEEICIEVLQTMYKDQFKVYDLSAQIEAKKTSTRVETLKRLLIVNDYIHDNIQQAISLDELSRVSALSRFHLYASFKTVYGQTPHQYINRLKMAKAKKYVLEAQWSISEIADYFGYNDLSVFGKVFKKTFGYSPTDYKMR
ncbi:MAG: AraC family transcriptional regulator [Bacteroidota bacterium]